MFTAKAATLIEHFTYAGVFVVLLLASLGLPVPEEVPILAGGILAHQQVVRWWIMLPVCIAGALSGDCVLYLDGPPVGRRHPGTATDRDCRRWDDGGRGSRW